MDFDLMNFISDLINSHKCFLVGDITKFIADHIISNDINLPKYLRFNKSNEKKFLEIVKHITIVANFNKNIGEMLEKMKKTYPTLSWDWLDSYSLKKDKLFWFSDDDNLYISYCDTLLDAALTKPRTYFDLAKKKDILNFLDLSRDDNEKLLKLINELMYNKDLYLLGDIIKYIASQNKDIKLFYQLVKTIEIYSVNSNDVVEFIDKYFKTGYKLEKRVQDGTIIDTHIICNGSLKIDVKIYYGGCLIDDIVWGCLLEKGISSEDRISDEDRISSEIRCLFKVKSMANYKPYTNTPIGDRLLDENILKLGEATSLPPPSISSEDSKEISLNSIIKCDENKKDTLIEKIENIYNTKKESRRRVFLKRDVSTTSFSVFCGIGEIIIYGEDEEKLLRKLYHILTIE